MNFIANQCKAFIYSFCGEWGGWVPVNRFNHTFWMELTVLSRSLIVVKSKFFVVFLFCLLTFIF